MSPPVPAPFAALSGRRVDKRTAQLAGDLQRLATLVAEARAHIAREHRLTDGAASAQTLSDGSRSTSTTTAVEAVVLARAGLIAIDDAILLDLNHIEKMIRACSVRCRRAIGTRLPSVPTERCHSSPDLPGYLVPIGLDGGWFDPLCTNPPRSANGQCDACRKRLDRWRERNEQTTLEDERSVTHDSRVILGERGVQHAIPNSLPIEVDA